MLDWSRLTGHSRIVQDLAAPAKPLSAVVQGRREELKLSRERLAANAGVSTSTIVRIERDGHCPKVDNLRAIAAALDLTLNDLLAAA